MFTKCSGFRRETEQKGNIQLAKSKKVFNLSPARNSLFQYLKRLTHAFISCAFLRSGVCWIAPMHESMCH